MRQYLILYFKLRMKHLTWRECFSLLMDLEATYEEQRQCETIYDEYYEKKRWEVADETTGIGVDEAIQRYDSKI